MSSSGSGAPDSMTNANFDGDGKKIIAPASSAIGTEDAHGQTTIVVPGLDLSGGSAPSSTSSSSNKENHGGGGGSAFDLLKNEELCGLFADHSEAPVGAIFPSPVASSRHSRLLPARPALSSSPIAWPNQSRRLSLCVGRAAAVPSFPSDTEYGIPFAGGAAGRRRDAPAADRWRLVRQERQIDPIDGVWSGRSPPMMARHNGAASKTAPSLRSVSLPKGADEAALGITAGRIAMTSPQLGRANSVRKKSLPDGDVLIFDLFQMSSVNEPPCTLAHPAMADKKAMKVVSEYYKKQNELLENFKADNEQIQDGEEDVSVVVSSAKRTTGGGTGAGGGGTGGQGAGKRSSMSEEDEEQGLLGEKALDEEGQSHKRAAALLSKATLFVNITLAILKARVVLVRDQRSLLQAAASYWTFSLSIISSLVDSLVDITSGGLILYSTRAIKKRDPYSYPRGRTRLEPMILVIISIVMGFASVQLIMESIKRIVKNELEIEMNLASAVIMVMTILAKSCLVLICKKYDSDPSIRVLAQDHRNDCVSNFVALVCAGLSPKKIGEQEGVALYENVFGMHPTTPWLQYLDPIGAILVSVYIIRTWWGTGKEHVKMLTGKSAEPEFINRIIKVCIDHDPRIEHIDTVYVYHYGMKFLVEVHIVLDENMPLKVAHDISESLQINIESLPDVERAFVHTDYEYEHLPADEHKVV
ncbi:hypothetical protein PRIPAC_93229 [Pristionchus pacificus]|uniref:ZT_dimer domain-containing protein n=1 Tax=Pristionchus pacificus TaxID=54126 RepID=A0A2A6CHF0_PRIPA|nr:hypothetical protein PRIPAC_93229 [Pristionchus pacificus]|eukprot:PDM77559.1 hypothetical protein PRIPAC_34426 [Pristionchus pacificus]